MNSTVETNGACWVPSAMAITPVRPHRGTGCASGETGDVRRVRQTVYSFRQRKAIQGRGLQRNRQRLTSGQKRGRRVVLGTNGSSTRELPDEILRAFRDWCASPEMQVMSASFTSLLTQN